MAVNLWQASGSIYPVTLLFLSFIANLYSKQTFKLVKCFNKLKLILTFFSFLKKKIVSAKETIFKN